MVTDKKRNTPGLGRRQSSRDTLWFRRPPPRRSRVTDMNREEKVSPTYHHRRSTGAPILSAGASARSPVGSARAGSTAARVWVVDRRDSVWRRCSPGSREADVSRPAGRRNSDGRVKTPPCGMCAERVAQHVRHRVEGSGGQRRQRCRACTGASILSPMGCASRRARSSRRAGSLRDAQSEMRVSANQALGLDGRGEAAAQWIA